MATPKVAPTMRAVLSMPEAVPERSGGSAATATPFTGAVFRPRPRPTPTTNISIETITRLVCSSMRASASAPAPMQNMPAVITVRGPKRLAK
jgi:hypothetical protein